MDQTSRENPENQKRFDASRYLTKVGSADYLEVKWRLVWLREEHPDAQIETEEIKVIPPGIDPEGGRVGWAMFKATIYIPSSRAKSTGYGSESIDDFAEYIEKAETKAIGRALGALGFGTQFTTDFDFSDGKRSDRPKVVDSPVTYRNTRPQVEPPPPPQTSQGSPQGDRQTPPGATANLASPRQRMFIDGLIRNAGENPDDFVDRASLLSPAEASHWIQQLQRGELPWLNEMNPIPKS